MSYLERQSLHPVGQQPSCSHPSRGCWVPAAPCCCRRRLPHLLGAFQSLAMDVRGGEEPGRSLTSPWAANRIRARVLAAGPGGEEQNALFSGNGQEKGDPGGGLVLGFQLLSPARPTRLALVSAALLQRRGLCLAWKPPAVLVTRLRVHSVVLPPLCTPQTIVRLCR